jgi:hypothetical protein
LSPEEETRGELGEGVMGQALGWEPNAIGNLAEAGEEYVEPAVNVPIYIDGYFTTSRDGMLHIAYYVVVNGPNGPERMIVARHVMPQSAVAKGRASTDAAILKGKRLLDG